MRTKYFTTKSVNLRIFGYRDEFTPVNRPDVVKSLPIVAYVSKANMRPALKMMSKYVSMTLMDIIMGDGEKSMPFPWEN